MNHLQFTMTGSLMKKSTPDETVVAVGTLNKRRRMTTTPTTRLMISPKHHLKPQTITRLARIVMTLKTYLTPLLIPMMTPPPSALLTTTYTVAMWSPMSVPLSLAELGPIPNQKHSPVAALSLARRLHSLMIRNLKDDLVVR